MEIVMEITREEAKWFLVWRRRGNCEEGNKEFELAKRLVIFTQEPSMDNAPEGNIEKKTETASPNMVVKEKCICDRVQNKQCPHCRGWY